MEIILPITMAPPKVFRENRCTHHRSTLGIPATADGTARATIVKALPPTDFALREIYAVGSPVLHDGLVYVTHSGWAGPPGRLFAVDPTEGNVIYNQVPDLAPEAFYSPHGAGIAASLALADKYLYMMDNRGTTNVVEPGRTYKPVARNVLENIASDGTQEITESTPIFDGACIYYRGQRCLYCIAQP